MGGIHKHIALGVWVAASLASGAARADERARGGNKADASHALHVLRIHCAPCHGGPAAGAKASRGGFGHVLDPTRMRAEGQLVAGAPDASELYKKIRSGDMPPKSVKTRPNAAEIAILRQWIASTGAAPAAPIAPATTAEVDKAIARDLDGRSQRRRTRTRYVTLAHLARAGGTDDELATARAAVSKLLNSLSWQPALARFATMGPRGTVMRIDLDSIGWSPGTWNLIAKRSPYAHARNSAVARRIRTATGSYTPNLRGDWLVAEASRSPLYHRLARIPPTEAILYRRLGIDASDDVFGRRVIRAGFSGSGVSRHNRIIQRHATRRGGYLWRSYDFRSSAGRRNIFAHPLEPGLAKRGFRHDGGEFIFSLPNGMQGYMLTDARGNRIDAAPSTIVTDPSRPDGIVRNGLSCMGCHQTGIIAKRDAIRPHVLANRLTLSRNDLGLAARALALYRGPPELARAMGRDRARFESALTRAGIASKVEPITWLVRQYEADPSAATVAAEIGVEPIALTALLRANADLATSLGEIARGGRVKRDVLRRAFPSLVQRFGLGRPLGNISRADRDRLSCTGGGARACSRAARKADRRHQRRQAFALHKAACAAGSARACHVVGQRLIDGTGTRRNLPQAAISLSRSCGLGRAGACVTLGNLHFNGGGVAQSDTNALGFYSRACQLGASRGCSNAAMLYESGRGVPSQPRTALKLYERACRGSVPKSCLRAGALYFDGRHTRRDRTRSARLFDRACRSGIGAACRRLAQQYRWGVGVSADWIRSERLFRRACRLGVDRACLYL